uniref:Putative product n=1 Tax=Xenopsylla cheopis TaxID=163159 RepID=A0A6M2DXF5_XENCH
MMNTTLLLITLILTNIMKYQMTRILFLIVQDLKSRSIWVPVYWTKWKVCLEVLEVLSRLLHLLLIMMVSIKGMRLWNYLID